MKPTKSAPKAAQLSPELMLTEAHTSLKRSLDELETSELTTPATIAGKSRLTEAMIKLSGELRQLQKQHRRDLARYTVEELVEHILGLADKQQKAIADAILRDGRAESSLFGES